MEKSVELAYHHQRQFRDATPMNMNRRAFLGVLLTAPLAAKAALSLQMAPAPLRCSMIAELNEVTLSQIYPAVVEDTFFSASPLVAYFKDHGLTPMIGAEVQSCLG